MKKSTIILIFILIIIIGMMIGFKISSNDNNITDTNQNRGVQNQVIDNYKSVEIISEEEKTTPSTLVIYKTYYTKCKHFIKRYEQIDASLVNLTEEELKEKCKTWKVESFSSSEIELSNVEEKFCNEHFKIILEDDKIVIYNVKEDGTEIKYDTTNITTEYLTRNDILKLKSGIIVYGKENLTSLIEDYE